MLVFDEELTDVSFHCEVTRSFCVVPVDINACKFGPRPVRCYFIVLFKGCEQVLGMVLVHVLDAKVVNNESG